MTSRTRTPLHSRSAYAALLACIVLFVAERAVHFDLEPLRGTSCAIVDGALHAGHEAVDPHDSTCLFCALSIVTTDVDATPHLAAPGDTPYLAAPPRVAAPRASHAIPLRRAPPFCV